MPTVRTYAGVGTGHRPATPQQIAAERFEETVVAPAARAAGFILQSGGAVGSDSAHERGAGDQSRIFYGNQRQRRNDGTYGPIPTGANRILIQRGPLDAVADRVVADVLGERHWGNIVRKGEFVRNLMRRNVNIILGEDLLSPVEFTSLYAIPQHDERGFMAVDGGTKSAFILSTRLGIPTYNYFYDAERDAMEQLTRDGFPPRTNEQLALTYARMADMGIATREQLRDVIESHVSGVDAGHVIDLAFPDLPGRHFEYGRARASEQERPLTTTHSDIVHSTETAGSATLLTEPHDMLPGQKPHINVYSRGNTELGRLLTNFARTPFVCQDGSFASVEGYWYWLSVDKDHPRREELRTAHGFQAKDLGRALGGQDWVNNNPSFEEKIKAAIDAKLSAHPRIATMLATSALPFRHYYVYGNTVREPAEGGWILQHLEARRDIERVRNGLTPLHDQSDITRGQPRATVLILVGKHGDVGEYIGRWARPDGTRSPLGNPYIVGVDGEIDVCAQRYARDLDGLLARSPIDGSRLRAREPAIFAEINRLTDRAQMDGSLQVNCHGHGGACHGDAVAQAVDDMLDDRSAGIDTRAPDYHNHRAEQRLAKQTPLHIAERAGELGRPLPIAPALAKAAQYDDLELPQITALPTTTRPTPAIATPTSQGGFTLLGEPEFRNNGALATLLVCNPQGETERVIATGDVARAAQQQLHRGDTVHIEGALETRAMPGGGLAQARFAESIERSEIGLNHNQERSRTA